MIYHSPVRVTPLGDGRPLRLRTARAGEFGNPFGGVNGN